MSDQVEQQEKKHWLHKFHARPSSAAIALENDKGEVLIVKANYKKHCPFPGGIIDADETPKQAALREVHEEIGLTIDPAAIQFGWVVARHSVNIDSYQFIFKAPLIPGVTDEIILQASEIDEWRLVTRADIAAKDVPYAKAVRLWASENNDGYIEQTIGVDA
jgi:8-oxo-dGTP pyrophosphatase MutT (NUDIX family)